jgi:hypothetical protein
VARDFTVAADGSAFLNLYERSNPGAVADFAAVEIDEVMNNDVAAQLNIGSDNAELSWHFWEARGPL